MCPVNSLAEPRDTHAAPNKICDSHNSERDICTAHHAIIHTNVAILRDKRERPCFAT